MTQHMESGIRTSTSGGAAMEFNILGPVRVTDDASSVNIGGPKQRAVLAVLVANLGKPVTADYIAQAVYGVDVPGRGRRTVQTYVSTLRSIVGDVIVKDGAAWALKVDRSTVDAFRFEDLCEAARGLEPEAASDLLREALSLWRGHPFADIEAHGVLDGETNRLTELRVSAQQARVDADLESGRHGELIGELEALLAEHPYSEGFRAQHMLALYRAGRQKESLLSYGQMRSTLLEELGVDPSLELRELEQRILEQDDSLMLAPRRSIQKRAVLVVDPGDPLELARLPAAEREYRLNQSTTALRSAVRQTDGGPVHPAGTSTYVVFDSPEQAATAAEMTNVKLDGSRMRMAIDWGDIEVSEGSVAGPPVSRAAVLVAVAHPGQVVLSTDAQQEIISDGGGTGIRFQSLGSHDLSGIEKPVPIFQLLIGDPPLTFPPLETDRVPPPLPEGGHRSVPGYELREPLGPGSVGTLYRSYQPSVGREVIIEVIGRSESSDPDFIRSFEADAQRLALLDHPNINPLLDYWRDTDGAYLVYRHHRGGFLQDGSSASHQILRQVGSALAYAHSYGVVHGSLRPDRVVLDDSGNAYLIGFPIGGVMPLSSPDYPAYIASETLAGRQPSVSTDVYALGVLATEIESGPIGGDEALAPNSEAMARAVSEDPAERHASIVDLLDELSPGEDRPAESRFTERRNPYKGLAAFHESDAADFYGRTQVTKDLVASLQRLHFLAVVGPSGIGKSSVVRAGLIPALRKGAVDGSETWVVTDMLPGSHPFLELQRALDRVAVDLPLDVRERFASRDPNALEGLERVLPEDSELLLVIDQFEELFTMTEEAVAAKFLDLLVTAVESHQARVVITLRADFLDRPLLYSEFGELLGDSVITLRSPNRTELEEAVRLPAERVGVAIEPALTERIVSEVHNRPSALPLLQYALAELFESRTSDMITVDAYEKLGGVTGSLAERAESIYRALEPGQQAVAKQVLLRLVAISDDSAPTRRRVKVTALEDLAATEVVDAFARGRLLAFDSDPDTRTPTVEVAHEAMLTHWPRLASWVEATREDLTLSRRLEESRLDWEENDRSEPYLLTGGRLAQHQTWSADTSLVLTDADTEYLAISAIHDGEVGTRRRRRRNWIMAAFAAGAVVAAVFGLAALSNARTADEKTLLAEESALQAQDAADRATASELVAQENAQDADSARVEAQSERDVAVAAGIVADAQRLVANASAVMDDDTDLALLLATQAVGALADDPKAVGVLRQAISNHRTLYASGEEELGLGEISPDGLSLVVGDDGGISARDVETGEILWRYVIEVPEGSGDFSKATYVNDGAEVAVSVLWVPPAEDAFATPPDSAGLHILDAETGLQLRHFQFGCGFTSRFQPVGQAHVLGDVFDADWVASNGCPSNFGLPLIGQVHLVNVNTGESSVSSDVIDLNTSISLLVAFDEKLETRLTYDPGAGRNGAAENQGKILVDDVASGERLLTIPGVWYANVAAISPDGAIAVVGGANLSGVETLIVYSLESGEEIATLDGHAGRTFDIEFISGGDRLLTAGADGVLNVWDPRAGMLVESISLGADQWSLSVSEDDQTVLVSGETLTVLSLNPADRAEIGVLNPCPGEGVFNLRAGLVVRGDRLLMSSICRGQSLPRGLMFDLPTMMPLGEGPFHSTQGIDLSFDGRFIASQGGHTNEVGGTVIEGVFVTDAITGARVEMEGLCDWTGIQESEECVEPPAEPYAAEALDLTFSPDGLMLAMGAVPGAPGRVWDTRTGEVLGGWEFNDVAFSLDGTRVVTVDAGNGIVEVRDTRDLDVVIVSRTLDQDEPWPWYVRLTNDGTMMVAASGTQVLLYDISTLETARTLASLSEAGILDLELSVDGSMLAAGGTDGFARVWDLKSGTLLHEIRATSTSKVQAVEFAAGDTHLVVSVADAPLKIYTLDSGELVDLARAKLARGFTERECDDYFSGSACPTLDEMRLG